MSKVTEFNKHYKHSLGDYWKYVERVEKALNGDIQFVVTQATVNTTATSQAWSRKVTVELQSADGEVHTWFNKAITNGVSIADTSTAGTASISSTTLTFVNGKVEVTVNGDAANWLATETNTLTVAQATILGYTVANKTSVETFV